MKPATRAALSLLLSKEWVSGNELADVAGYRYPARLGELKPLGFSWDKKYLRGRSVPIYRIHAPQRAERAAARAYWDKRPQEEQESLAVALGAPES